MDKRKRPATGPVPRCINAEGQKRKTASKRATPDRASLTLASVISASLSPEVFVEKIQGSLPSQLGRRLVVTWRCVVMETMVDALIDVHGVGHVIRLKRFLVGRPSLGNARIKRCIVKQKGRLD